MAPNVRRVPIRPRVGVFSVFEAVDYKAWFALAEFVDNSIQSRIDSARAGLAPELTPSCPLQINIRVEGGNSPSISIQDNAGGIPLERFDRAFEIGSPPPDPSGLSVYGIGMKSAAAWFGRHCTIETTCPGEAILRRVVFDFPAIISSGLEELDVVESVASVDSHGTLVVLRDLKHPIQSTTHTKVRDHLTSIYRNFIREGLLQLTYRGELATYADPEVLEAPWFREREGPSMSWMKEIDFELSSGERVQGFAAIRKVGRAAGSGFSLYRGRRVITGLDDDPWRPKEIFGFGNSYRSQRLFGELHLTNVKVAYSKNGFVWQASEEELIDRLRAELDSDPLPLLKQAEGYRSREPEARQRSASRRALDGTAGAVAGAVENDLPDRVGDAPADAPTPPTFLSPPAVASRNIDVNFMGQRWSVDVELSENDDGDWLELADSGSPTGAFDEIRRVAIRININNDFMRRFGGSEMNDMEALMRLGSAVALATVIAREQGVRFAETLLRHINQLLRGSLAR